MSEYEAYWLKNSLLLINAQLCTKKEFLWSFFLHKAANTIIKESFHTKTTKKIFTLSDFFENWHTCWVHRETTPDQNLAYFNYSPLRYDR